MNSSGIKRGLAGSAITALAITGLPFLATSAQAAHGETEVTLISQGAAGNDASVKNDGQNNTIRLEAEVLNGTTPVTFQYNPDPAADLKTAGTNWVTITTTVANDDGYASFEWDGAGLVGGQVALRAAVTVNGVTKYSGRNGVAILGGGAAAESVNINNGSAKGVFQEPYTETAGNQRNVIVDGTTSSTDTTDKVSLYWWDDATDAKRPNDGAAPPATTTTADVKVAKDAKTGTFSGVVNVDGFDFSGNPDEIAFGAELDTDDVEAFTLYNQEIGAVTAAPTSSTVAGNGTKDVVVTVVDQNGAPIAGAEVRSSTDPDTTDAANGPSVGYTNAKGQVTVKQSGGVTAYYYANATDSNPFEAGLGDKRSEDVSVGQYNPQASSLKATSANGSAFDYDEYDADDIQIQVQDQQGNDFSTTQVIEYSWTFTAFDGTPSGSDLNQPNGTVTAVNGKANIPLPEQVEGGTYTLNASLRAIPASGQGAVAASDVLTVKAGEADIKFDDAQESAPAGTKQDVTGKLVLEDGTGLGARPIRLQYAGGNAAFDQPTGADSTTRDVTTGTDGTFSATLDDPAATSGAQPTETGTITATTRDYTDPNTPLDTDNADDSTDQQVTFSQATPPAGTTVVIGGAIAAANQQSKPGTAVDGNVLVTAPDNTNDTDPNTPGVQGDADTNRDVVAQQIVTLTVDGDSFFTDGSNDPKAAEGKDTGELKSLGQSITVTTDSNGNATFKVAVERSEEFDDDGLAEDIVTAAAGSATDTEDVDYSSSDPRNGGEVRLVESPASFQDSKVLPEAQVGQEVFFDVFVTDQFGNLVGDESVTITENGPFSTVNFTDEDLAMNGRQVKSDFIFDADFSATATRPNDQQITASWTTETSKFNAAGTATPGTETLTDSYTINWYAVDFANSTFTITSSPEGDVIVGQPVTETVKVVDENGNPVSGLDVSFIRQGPGDQQDGDANNKTKTNSNGEAFYSFTGTEAGTANISAVISDGQQNKTLTDTVTFVAPGNGGTDCTVAPSVLISGDDNGGAKDVVRFVTEDCATGDSLQLFKIRGTKRDGNKRLVEVRQTEVEDGAEMVFKVRDANGNKKTRFVAKVKGDTYGTAKSNTQKIR